MCSASQVVVSMSYTLVLPVPYAGAVRGSVLLAGKEEARLLEESSSVRSTINILKTIDFYFLPGTVTEATFYMR